MFLTLSSSLYSLYVLVGLIIGLATLIGYIKRPWTEKAKKRRLQKKMIKLFMNGDPGIKGLIAEVIPGPERVANAENAIKEHTQLLKQQGEVQRKQGKTLDTVVSGLNNLTNLVIELDKKMTSNGGNTNNPGDVLMRQAKRTGDWLTDEELKRINENNEEHHD